MGIVFICSCLRARWHEFITLIRPNARHRVCREETSITWQSLSFHRRIESRMRENGERRFLEHPVHKEIKIMRGSLSSLNAEDSTRIPRYLNEYLFSSASIVCPGV